MENIEQFSLYAATIFKTLYESFPCPTKLDSKEIVSYYSKLDLEKENKILHFQKKCIEMHIKSTGSEFAENAKDNFQFISDLILQKENEQHCKTDNFTNIFNETVEFLTDEELITKDKNGNYRLTAKSYSRLNIRFVEPEVVKKEQSFISAINDIFHDSECNHKDFIVSRSTEMISKLLSN